MPIFRVFFFYLFFPLFSFFLLMKSIPEKDTTVSVGMQEWRAEIRMGFWGTTWVHISQENHRAQSNLFFLKLYNKTRMMPDHSHTRQPSHLSQQLDLFPVVRSPIGDDLHSVYYRQLFRSPRQPSQFLLKTWGWSKTEWVCVCPSLRHW